MDVVWDVKLFRRHRDDDPAERCPAEEFLAECPPVVAAELLAIVDDVASAPPPRYSGSLRWQAMHGDMGGFYEARTRGPGKRLYRLFCILERSAPGLAGPTIAVITGMWKPNASAFSEADYARVRRLGDEYRRQSPRNVT